MFLSTFTQKYHFTPYLWSRVRAHLCICVQSDGARVIQRETMYKHGEEGEKEKLYVKQGGGDISQPTR